MEIKENKDYNFFAGEIINTFCIALAKSKIIKKNESHLTKEFINQLVKFLSYLKSSQRINFCISIPANFLSTIINN